MSTTAITPRFDSIQKYMDGLSTDELQKYLGGNGAYPQEEQMAALFSQAKRAGMDADTKASQPVEGKTVAQDVNQKAIFNHIQELAAKNGMQITGIAPIGAGLGSIPPQGLPPMPPQGGPAPGPAPIGGPPPGPPGAPPTGLPGAQPQMPAPQGAVPQNLPPPQQPQQPPAQPTHMAHGGIAHAVPHHMFNFSRGGGIMGFDGTDGSDVNAATAAVNQAMPEEMPDHASLTPMQYDQQRAAALQAVKDNFTPAPKRQETYAERDARMHEAPSLSSYKDPFSLANISAAFNNSGYQPLSSNPIPNVGSPVDAEPASPFPAGYVRHNMENDPRLNNTTPVNRVAPNAGINHIPSAPVVKPPAAPVGPTAPVRPTAAPAAPVGPTASPPTGTDYRAMEDKQLSEKASISDEFKRLEEIQQHFGLNTPAGIDAEKRAHDLAEMYKKMNEEHPFERTLQVLRGMGRGRGGAADAYLSSESAFRAARENQAENINRLLTPIEQARRAEAQANALHITTNMSEKEKERAKQIAEMAKTQLTGDQQMARAIMEQKAETERSNARIAAEKFRTNLELNNPNRGINSTDIYNSMKEDIKNGRGDPALKGKTDAELRAAAIAAASGQENKLGFQSINAILNSAIKAHTAAMAGFDDDAKIKAQQDLTDAKRMMQNFHQGLDPYTGIGQSTQALPMPSADKLTAYAAAHFGGDIEKAKNFLASQGYK